METTSVTSSSMVPSTIYRRARVVTSRQKPIGAHTTSVHFAYGLSNGLRYTYNAYPEISQAPLPNHPDLSHPLFSRNGGHDASRALILIPGSNSAANPTSERKHRRLMTART